MHIDVKCQNVATYIDYYEHVAYTSIIYDDNWLYTTNEIEYVDTIKWCVDSDQPVRYVILSSVRMSL